MRRGHVTGTKRERTGASDWYRAHEKANLARIEATIEQEIAMKKSTVIETTTTANTKKESTVKKSTTSKKTTAPAIETPMIATPVIVMETPAPVATPKATAKKVARKTAPVTTNEHAQEAPDAIVTPEPQDASPSIVVAQTPAVGMMDVWTTAASQYDFIATVEQDANCGTYYGEPVRHVIVRLDMLNSLIPTSPQTLCPPTLYH